ncbi:hypothetical protein QWY28_06585 [Nocardioides sp. SOB77]|uniref:HIRAN domain-containing protein n=1 Tax=Nocardioides oceani TaxID=3058369 RepID=A0ABT8FEK1_9ACTN|nr:hypothetical protein [Nocardioides oceani]MDN4172602.1 hypothetical protein [Nocardioides oceani]
MEIMIGVIFIAFLVWVVARHRRGSGTPQNPSRSLGQQSQLRVDIDSSLRRDFGRSPTSPELRRVSGRTADHVPHPPVGAGEAAWSPRTQQLEVAGEWYRADELRALFTRHSKVSDSGAELRLPATLVPDAANPHDPKAVAVFVDGLHVGYMERADAQKYHDAIGALPGGELVATSRQWLRASATDTWARVTLSLPLPEHLKCPNPLGADCISIPPGSTVQVTREVDHMAHLAGLLDQYGSDTVVAASLRAMTEQRPRSTIDVVAVDIDGRQVGVLSPTQTANFLPLVRRAEAEGRRISCRASLRGNTLKADVALHACKAHELDESELQSLFATH